VSQSAFAWAISAGSSLKNSDTSVASPVAHRACDQRIVSKTFTAPASSSAFRPIRASAESKAPLKRRAVGFSDGPGNLVRESYLVSPP
jgi:hypothetical protein